MVQEQVFLAEIKSLQSKGVVSPNSKLRNVNPFIDSGGLLRVGGRLSNSDLPYVNKHPAILPGNHNLTVQIIAHFHRKNLHTGASSLLHYVREKFWPLNGRSLCRKVVHECFVSFKSRSLVTSQLMGNLPRDRVVPDYPFNCSGVDFCGPFMIRKTFVGANKELKRFLKLIEDSDDNLAGFLFSAEGIEWKFIPPRAPYFSGLWEASVKSIKYHLKRVVSGSNLTYEEFLTVCIHIEGILNSRPLCPLSSNLDDLNALTPAHSLRGRSMTSVVESNLIELKENALKKCDQTRALETVQEQEPRRKSNCLQMMERRISETAEDREGRLESQRNVTRSTRVAIWIDKENAAYSYNPSTDYKSDASRGHDKNYMNENWVASSESLRTTVLGACYKLSSSMLNITSGLNLFRTGRFSETLVRDRVNAYGLGLQDGAFS
ncbi:integrase catalytic domain-containing protein [Trichonephila clavipes]|nr:integrase catalytic domain-containing protein [Trichonephila clavipes]